MANGDAVSLKIIVNGFICVRKTTNGAYWLPMAYTGDLPLLHSPWDILLQLRLDSLVGIMSFIGTQVLTAVCHANVVAKSYGLKAVVRNCET